MQTINFYKYHGAGNDFVLIDNRNKIFDAKNFDLVAHLCNRRFGIGADGLMLLQNADNYDFEMLYYNADGQLGSMCGNGARCIVAFAKHLNIIETETTFLAVDGPHYAKIINNGNWVSLQMIDVDSVNRDGDAYVLNTGSPHYVKLVKNIDNINVYELGKAIRKQPNYIKKGINVNFVENIDNTLELRTYERGVENETLACGTGATAAALAMAIENNIIGHNNTKVNVKGGKLNILFNYDGSIFTDVYLEGPATLVFTGQYSVKNQEN